LSDTSKLRLPLLLTFNGGYVDTAGFLALQGLFVAHVTGNFVTLGAAVIQGGSGIAVKLLALPVFCCAVISFRWIVSHFKTSHPLPAALAAQGVLLALACALAIQFQSVTDTDDLRLIGFGLVLVVSMAIQNAAHRLYLAWAPPSTLMTGTTTQVMIDLADLLQGCPVETHEVTKARFRSLGAAVLCFAAGCGVAALAYFWLNRWCFALPPVTALAASVLAAKMDRK